MIFRISIQINSSAIEQEKYALAEETAENWLKEQGYVCVRPADAIPALWQKTEEETVFNPGRIMKAQVHKIKTIEE